MKGSTPKARGRHLNSILKRHYDEYGESSNVVDILTDLRHLCTLYNWDYAELDRIARNHHEYELTDKERHGI